MKITFGKAWEKQEKRRVSWLEARRKAYYREQDAKWYYDITTWHYWDGSVYHTTKVTMIINQPLN